MGSNSEHVDAPPIEVGFKGFLFDMDGTVIDSTEAVVKHWHSVGKELGIDPNVILETSHGRRSIDVLRVIDPEKANWEYIKYMESLLPKLYGDSVVEIPGARSLLDSLTAAHTPWTIVTSGTTPLVSGWLGVLKLPMPDHLVAAEDVEHGKPDPEGYLMGKEKLGLKDETEVLVLEDSPAGIKAGKSAGCKVLAVVTTHTLEQVVDAGADWVVKDLRSVRVVEKVGERVTLKISDSLMR
ncbi:hypothetical protein B7494_g7496 [Chlorociboria aeruginascens]|nr:hypothetical protein B7494_g7496 [Chlorociboria aeruginascens]